MDEVNLPDGWTQATIDDLIGVRGVYRDGDWVESKDQDPDGDVRLIQLADIGDGEFRDKSSRFLTAEKSAELNCTYLENGDILVARMPDPLGRACLFPLHGEKKFVTVVDVCVIRFGHNLVDEKYFMYILNSPMSRRNINDHQTGSTRKRISRGNLSTVYFPIAPINEQHRIVAKIEELFSELDKGIENLKTAREQLKVYRQALLKHAFEGKLTAQWREQNRNQLETAATLLARIQTEREQRYQQQLQQWRGGSLVQRAGKPKAPKPLPPLTAKELAELPELPEGWGWVRLGDLAGQITKGASPNWQGISYVDDPSQVLFVTSENVRENFIDISKPKYVEIAFNEKQPNSVLRIGDLLINIVGASIGRATVFNLEACANVNQAVSVVRIPTVELRQYISLLLNTHFASIYYAKNAVDVARANLSLVDVANIPIPLCALSEIAEILNGVGARLSEADQLELTLTASLQQAEALRQSILKRAFSGQLVPQDPNDEPAAALLARIQAEREAPSAKPRKTGKGKT